MKILITIIGCGIIMGWGYWLYETLKARYVVRRFFIKAVEVEELYGLYTLSEYGKIGEERVKISLKLEVTEEDIEYILDLAEEAISYCDKNCLRDFEEPTIEKIYYNLEEITIELRRWLWVNKTNC